MRTKDMWFNRSRCEISLSGLLGPLQFLMLHEVVRPTSHVALVKCVKCESSSLEIAQQIAAARPFPHDIPRISKSEDLSSKMSIMAFHGTYGTSIIQSTKLPMENVFFALRLQFGGSWWIIGHHMIQIYSNIFQ